MKKKNCNCKSKKGFNPNDGKVFQCPDCKQKYIVDMDNKAERDVFFDNPCPVCAGEQPLNLNSGYHILECTCIEVFSYKKGGGK